MAYRKIKYYDFDLDLEPSKRWVKIFDVFEPKLKGIKIQLEKILNQYGPVVSIAAVIFDSVDKSHIMFHDELTYVASRMGLPLYQIIILQLIYEMSAACTAAIFTVRKTEYFLRTMDWPMSFLKDITVGLNIKSGSKSVGQVIGWVGCVGFFTTTTDTYVTAINYRRTTELDTVSMIANAFRTIGMKWPISYLVRSVLERQASVTDAINTFETAELISPTYITVYVMNPSPGIKSVIITRDADQLVHTRTHDLLQTNCDFDKDVPDILWSSERKELFGFVLAELNEQEISSKKIIMKSFLRAPIVNSDTIYVYFRTGGKAVAIV